MSNLYHIARAARVQEAEQAGVYAPAEFDHDGFIHCSYAHQLPQVASRSWSQDRWVLLEIDRSQVAAQVIDENLEGGVDLFPHLYRKLPLTAVVAVHPLLRNADTGQLALPAGVIEPPPVGVVQL